MKNIVKLLIALFFIFGAFFIGKYIGLEENKSNIKQLGKNISILEGKISESENVIKKMKVEIATCKDSLLEMTEKQGITKANRNAGKLESTNT